MITESQTEKKLQKTLQKKLEKLVKTDEDLRSRAKNAHDADSKKECFGKLMKKFKDKYPNFFETFYKKEIRSHARRDIAGGIIAGIIYFPLAMICISDHSEYKKRYKNAIEQSKKNDSVRSRKLQNLLTKLANDVIGQYLPNAENRKNAFETKECVPEFVEDRFTTV